MEKLFETYKTKYRKELKDELKLKNIFQVPNIEKISVNMGFGKFKDNKDFVEEAKNDIAAITGQMPSKRLSKESISNFKLREGDLIGYAVTLRGEKAWDFLEKVIKSVMPAVRDFRGLSNKSFDGQGNYSFGIKEHFVFPEINPDKVKHIKSLQINIKSSVRDDNSLETLLEKIGFPFKNKK